MGPEPPSSPVLLGVPSFVEYGRSVVSRCLAVGEKRNMRTQVAVTW